MGREIPFSNLREPKADYDSGDMDDYVICDKSGAVESVLNEFARLLDGLTPQEKMIVELSVVGGVTVRDMSRLIGLSKGNVVARRIEAINKMREKMRVQKENIRLITGRNASLQEIIEMAG